MEGSIDIEKGLNPQAGRKSKQTKKELELPLRVQLEGRTEKKVNRA